MTRAGRARPTPHTRLVSVVRKIIIATIHAEASLVMLCTLAADAFTLQSISAQLHQRRVAVTMMADPPAEFRLLKERMKAAMKSALQLSRSWQL